jgi:hypothetical protein
MLYDFQLAGRRVRLWQRVGESYEHVLMKALGYAMFVGKFPELAIEQKVGLRYKPDLVARASDGQFLFWGECGQTTVRKTAWLLKHGGVERLTLFKIGINSEALANELRAAIDRRYRLAERAVIINFVSEVAELAESRRIESVPAHWFTKAIV